MKLKSYLDTKSSFLSLEKDYELIVQRMLLNENLKKLLYYTDENCLDNANLTQEQSYSLINKQIKIVPKIPVDKEQTIYIVLTMDNFSPNGENDYYRDNTVSIDIICNYDVWNLGDFRLRPWKIAGEIDRMLNKQHFTGIGELRFISADLLLLADDFGGVSLSYSAIHGNDDKLESE
jgi:hypothetical protein